MSKPRQEFLGPITKLAAIDVGGNWVSDGVGVVDGYGATIKDIVSVSFDPASSSAKSLTLAAQSFTTSGSGGNLILAAGAKTTDNSSSGNIIFNHGSLTTLTLERGTSPTNSTLLFAADLTNIEITQATTGGIAGLITILGGFSPSGVGGSLVLMSGGGSGGTGLVTIGASATPILTVNNQSGKSWLRNDGYIQLTEQASVSSSIYTTEQSYNQRIVAGNPHGYGSYTINPYAANQGNGLVARADKQFGTFNLIGTAQTNTLSFTTAIHGFPMPATAVLVGTFRIGWLGDGTYTGGGAMQFLFTVSSDASGNINAFNSSISDNFGVPGSSANLVAGSAPSSTHGQSMYMLPSSSHTPLIDIVIPAGPTTTYQLLFQAVNNGVSDTAKYFWEVEYGWGSP